MNKPLALKKIRGIVADPSGENLSSLCLNQNFLKEPKVLIIGPEGGFIPYEVEKLQEVGCEVLSLGQRILKVETALVTLLAKLF